MKPKNIDLLPPKHNEIGETTYNRVTNNTYSVADRLFHMLEKDELFAIWKRQVPSYMLMLHVDLQPCVILFITTQASFYLTLYLNWNKDNLQKICPI